MAEDFLGWQESNWVSPDIDWQKGNLITGGCDVGSTSSQFAVMVDGKIYAYSSIRSKGKGDVSGKASIELALKGTDMKADNIEYIVGTGYGRVALDFANKLITEISCHARGANNLYGDSVRTILDMGGQDLKVISCNETGKVESFVMNDKCAAGAGRGFESMANLLGMTLEEASNTADYEGQLPDISPECTVFAKSDAMRRLKEGWTKEGVMASYSKVVAAQVHAMLTKVGVKREFCITGGIAKNRAVVKELIARLGFEPLKPDFDTQIAGAVGAALYAKALAERARG